MKNPPPPVLLNAPILLTAARVEIIERKNNNRTVLPVVIVFAVKPVVPVVARLGQRHTARGTRDALLVPAARAHSHQEPVHDFRAAALTARRSFAAVAVC